MFLSVPFSVFVPQECLLVRCRCIWVKSLHDSTAAPSVSSTPSSSVSESSPDSCSAFPRYSAMWVCSWWLSERVQLGCTVTGSYRKLADFLHLFKYVFSCSVVPCLHIWRNYSRNEYVNRSDFTTLYNTLTISASSVLRPPSDHAWSVCAVVSR